MYKVILICIVLVLLYFSYNAEGFVSKDEKATTIVDWFMNNPTPSYSAFRNDLNSKSNIVEYEDALSLLKDKDLTVENIKQKL